MGETMNRRGFLKLLVVGTIGLALAPIRRSNEDRKIEMVQRAMKNAIITHDRMIEEAIFSGSFSEQAAWERIL